MRVQGVVPWIAVVGTLTGWSSRAAVGQELTLAPRTLRFFYAWSTEAKPVEVDVGHNAVLGRVVSLHVEHTTIGGLLAEIQRQTGLTFAYDPHFPVTRAVTIEAESITVGAALGAILIGTGVDVVLMPTGHVWLTESKPGTSRVQEGTIVGKVTDKQRGEPIIGATVVLDPGRKSTTTGPDGRYRFANLSLGNYTMRVRYIGYVPLVTSVTVRANEEMTVDFSLAKSVQRLEEVVTTGTVLPTEVKAIPTPVSVITESDITLQRPYTVQGLLRQAIPGSVSWDLSSSPDLTTFSARGATTLNPNGTGQMKVFVDGIEATTSTAAAVDPMSVERIEVVRGPQAAAIYGSDAIGGVVQIFTKRGGSSLTRPQVSGEAALGLVQTPYAGQGEVLRQEYKASVHGAGTDVSYNFGTSFSHTNDWIPNGELSAQSRPSVYGGMRFTRGAVTADISARYFENNAPIVFNPLLSESGFSFFSKPRYLRWRVTNQTVGVRVTIASTRWWQTTVTAGIDRAGFDQTQVQRRFTTPGDTLLSLSDQNRPKKFVGVHTSLQVGFSPSLAGSLTLGVDHYDLQLTQFFTSGALNTTGGSIQVAPNRPLNALRIGIKNTGYFAQAQLSIYDALFLTGALRAEENTEFGDSLGTPVSPRLGASYVRRVAGATLKFRASYGGAIRPPSPGQKIAVVSPTGAITLANSDLGPERQRGWDAGADVGFGDRGSLSATYYNQTAENLIDFVLVQATPAPTSQYQNIGRVRNIGIELEGTLNFGALQLKGNYGYARSRVASLSPSYTGDLLVGDQVRLTPRHTAGASATVAPLPGTTVIGGLTYVGSWTTTDWLAYYGCIGGTAPCRNSTFAVDRSYVVEYPSFVKVNLGITQQITPIVSGFLAVDNLTNNDAYELWNFYPIMGRISTIGLRFQY
jgi:outer membrane receptor protein involved in Fe transport